MKEKDQGDRLEEATVLSMKFEPFRSVLPIHLRIRQSTRLATGHRLTHRVDQQIRRAP